jgi:uncharacterized protein YjiS (DUF1127 family)
MSNSIVLNGGRVTVADASQGLFARLAKMVADYRAYQRTLSELGRLSDRELADLGLHRSDIASLARESVYGK